MLFILTQSGTVAGSAYDLGRAGRAVTIAGDDDVQAVEGNVTLHTLGIDISPGYHIGDIAQLADAGGDVFTVTALFGNGKCPRVAAIAPQSVNLSGRGDNLLVVEASDKLNILGRLIYGHTK